MADTEKGFNLSESCILGMTLLFFRGLHFQTPL